MQGRRLRSSFLYGPGIILVGPSRMQMLPLPAMN